MKKIIVALFCLVQVSALAQKFTIHGQVTDTLSAAMPSATVMLLNAKDSSLVNFGVSDGQGSFSVKNVNRGNYLLKVTFVGFTPATHLVEEKDFTSPVVEVGKMIMRPVSSELDALIVQGDKAPVTVKKDTIEFNAGSFKTKPNANVEDLIKKMPGMEVQTDGSIRAQGEQVQRVTVDGREFFGRDPKLATRNLPADAVEKVQVFDKKSDQALFTGVDDGQREKTINLALKEDKKNGAFGNIMGGAGTEDRFQAKASVNRFSKQQQLSFLGMGNNVNEQGFSIDDYMNFSGGSQQMMSASGGGRMTLQFDANNSGGVPLNFGGRQNGIMTNYAAGLNFNRDYGTKTKLMSSYFFNHINQDVSRVLERTNFLPNNQSYQYNQVSRQISNSGNHRANFSLDHQIDSANSIKFAGSGTYTTFNQSLQSQSETMNVDGTIKNRNIRNTNTDGQSSVFNSSLLYRHRFEKKGRSFSANLTAGFNSSTNDGTLNSTNEYFDVTNEKKIIDQTNHLQSDNQTYGAQLSYIEPLGNRKYLEFNYGIRTNQNEVNKEVYNINAGVPVFNDTLSNHYKSDYLYNRPGISFRMNRQKYTLTAGINYQFTRLKGDLISRDTTVNRTFSNFLPVVRLNYDFSSVKHLRIDYETSMIEPTIQQLQPVIDNSDPVNLSSGNPNLKPGYQHAIRTSYNQFDPGKFIGFFGFINAIYTTDAITYSQTVDANLVRLTVPVNVKDNLNVSGNFNLSFPVKAIKGRFSLGPTGSLGKSINLLNLQENTAWQRTLGGNFRYDYTLGDIFNLGLSYNLSRQTTEYSFNTSQNQQYLNETYSAEANLNFLKNYALAAGYDYYHYRSQTTSFDQAIPILNLSVSRFLLKNNTGELRLAVVNALDKSMSVSQSANVNYIQQEVTNNLGRYYMLSFTYALNKQLNPMGGGRRGAGGMRMMIRN